MKTYKIKYETYPGNVRTETVKSYDERSAINQLVNCKKVHWVEFNDGSIDVDNQQKDVRVVNVYAK